MTNITLKKFIHSTVKRLSTDCTSKTVINVSKTMQHFSFNYVQFIAVLPNAILRGKM